jgi:acyl-CoA thioester hydrolase
MSKIFTRTFRVRWAELDPSGNVSPANYFRYIVETAWDWGVALGLDADYSEDTDVFWVIREAELKFFHPLRHNDEVDLTLWLMNWQRVRGTRCIELTHKETGAVIAQGTQQVVYMDSKTGRPKSIADDLIERFKVENPRIFPFEKFPKITITTTPFTAQRQVEWMDLDVYGHVNNATYINYAEEAAAQELTSKGWSPAKLSEANLTIATRRVHILYAAMAGWGETLSIATQPLAHTDTGGTRYIHITRADGSPVAECILAWELVDRQSGAPRALPAELR